LVHNKFITKLLKLKGLKVKDVYYSGYGNILNLEIKTYKNGCICPTCGLRGQIIVHAKERRTWQDVSVCGKNIYFHYSPKEILCKTHGRVQEVIPWADSYSRITYRLEYVILKYSQIMTQKEAAKLLKMATSTFSDILHRSIEKIVSTFLFLIPFFLKTYIHKKID